MPIPQYMNAEQRLRGGPAAYNAFDEYTREQSSGRHPDLDSSELTRLAARQMRSGVTNTSSPTAPNLAEPQPKVTLGKNNRFLSPAQIASLLLKGKRTASQAGR